MKIDKKYLKKLISEATDAEYRQMAKDVLRGDVERPDMNAIGARTPGLPYKDEKLLDKIRELEEFSDMSETMLKAKFLQIMAKTGLRAADAEELVKEVIAMLGDEEAGAAKTKSPADEIRDLAKELEDKLDGELKEKAAAIISIVDVQLS